MHSAPLNKYKVGDVVKSIAGKDIGIYYVVIDRCGRFLYLAGPKNGMKRLKRKNIKHVQKVNMRLEKLTVEEVDEVLRKLNQRGRVA